MSRTTLWGTLHRPPQSSALPPPKLTLPTLQGAALFPLPGLGELVDWVVQMVLHQASTPSRVEVGGNSPPPKQSGRAR